MGAGHTLCPIAQESTHHADCTLRQDKILGGVSWRYARLCVPVQERGCRGPQATAAAPRSPSATYKANPPQTPHTIAGMMREAACLLPPRSPSSATPAWCVERRGTTGGVSALVMQSFLCSASTVENSESIDQGSRPPRIDSMRGPTRHGRRHRGCTPLQN